MGGRGILYSKEYSTASDFIKGGDKLMSTISLTKNEVGFLTKAGVEVKITEKNKLDPFEARFRPVGFNNDTPYIEMKKGIESPKETFYHELGHAINSILFQKNDGLRDRDPVNLPKEREKLGIDRAKGMGKLITGDFLQGGFFNNYLMDPNEAFAHAYMTYRTKPKKLKYSAPGYYNFFQKNNF